MPLTYITRSKKILQSIYRICKIRTSSTSLRDTPFAPANTSAPRASTSLRDRPIPKNS